VVLCGAITFLGYPRYYHMHNVYNRKQERVVIIINLEIIYIKYNKGKFLKSIKSFFIIN
jgi:hypothetical protein